jgi:hypothetical protein
MRAEEYANLVLARVPKLRVRLFDSDSFFRNEKICTIQESIPYPKFGKKNRSYFQKESFKRFFKIAVKTLFSGTTIHGFRGGRRGGAHTPTILRRASQTLSPKKIRLMAYFSALFLLKVGVCFHGKFMFSGPYWVCRGLKTRKNPLKGQFRPVLEHF